MPKQRKPAPKSQRTKRQILSAIVGKMCSAAFWVANKFWDFQMRLDAPELHRLFTRDELIGAIPQSWREDWDDPSMDVYDEVHG